MPDAHVLAKSFNSWRGGLAMMLVGGSILGVGLVQTTGATTEHGCPDGTVLVARFNLDGNNWGFEIPPGHEGVVTLNASPTGGHWDSTTPISAIIVKGGPGSATTWFTPAQSSGEFSDAGLPADGSGHTPNIAKVTFCGAPAQSAAATTTTAAPTTTAAKHHDDDDGGSAPTTTAATTTTAVTTTTAAPTTTTAPTTIAAPTTIEGAPTTPTTTTTTTTTVAPTTTAAPTTTIAPTTTTTVADAQVQTVTSISQDDNVQVLANGTTRPLATTGSPSIPMIIIGIILLAAGAALVIVSQLRARRTHSA